MSGSSKQEKVSNLFTPSNPSILPSSSQRYKSLSDAIVKFILRDLRPVSVVDGIGFLNLMHIADPYFAVLCRKTIMSVIDKKHQEVKLVVHNQLAQQHSISLTSDM